MIDGFRFKFKKSPKMDGAGLPKIGNYKVPDFIDVEDCVCIDLGSACGGFIAKHYKKFNSIFAVEACYPNFMTTHLLVQKLDIHCVLFNLAISKETGKTVDITWDSQKRPYGNCIGKQAGHDVSHAALTVGFKDLMKLINKPHIHYLKLDIEGSEYDFLYGEDLSKISIIAMELHQSLLGKKKASSLVNYILENGFKLIHEGGGTNTDLTFENETPNCNIKWRENLKNIPEFSGHNSVKKTIKKCIRRLRSYF